jgi:hypothetical protein
VYLLVMLTFVDANMAIVGFIVTDGLLQTPAPTISVKIGQLVYLMVTSTNAHVNQLTVDPIARTE